MLATKLVTFLLLALAVVSLNVKSSHDAQVNSVTFKVATTYSLPPAPFYQWSDFPGLGGQFHVGVQRSVLIAYNIQTLTSSPDYFVTRLIIDGVEDERFRVISGGSLFHSNTINLPVYLSEGAHKVKLQFRSSGPVTNVIYEDWKQAYVQVNYI